MKRLISGVLAVITIFTLTSCSPQNAPTEIDKLQAEIAQKEAEIVSLVQQLTEKSGGMTAIENEKNELINEIEELYSQISELQDFKSTYGTYVEVIDSYNNKEKIDAYRYRIKDLPDYEEGSIALEPQTGWVLLPPASSPFSFEFERNYRYSYYESGLPLLRALRVVRGYTGNEVYIGRSEKESILPCTSYYIAQVLGGDKWMSEPLMHYFSWFILAYNVNRDEMEQMVEILSDKEHIVYDTVEINGGTYHGINAEDIDFTHEYYELPNVDILYTFDADIINEYYRYA